MADVLTKLTDLINPEVMADMINEKLVDMIKFSPLAKVDTTLQGRAGDTVTLPKYAYIGSAADVAEGADFAESGLTASSTTVKVKKAGKAVRLTDEALLSSYGDPMGETTRQLGTAIAQKVDDDCLATLNTIKAGMTLDVSAADILSANVVADALVKFGEDVDGQKILLIAPSQFAQLRKDPNYINKSDIATDILIKGTVGEIWGCQIVISNKIKAVSGKITNFIVKPEALAIYLKRDAMVEQERNTKNKTTLITADEHYTVHLLDEGKALKIVAKEK